TSLEDSSSGLIPPPPPPPSIPMKTLSTMSKVFYVYTCFPLIHESHVVIPS
ncbi:hypothetical protein PRIPAC_81115, partial [Pristionchus pacificus]